MFEKNLIKFTTVRLQKVLPNFFKGFFFVDGSVFIKIRAKDIKRVLYFFKTHICVRFKQLQDVCVADFLVLKKKFILFYQLLSIDSNFRISVCVCAGRTQSLLSVASLFLSANWIEREIWDMFGVFFYGHRDLRRILTDYGFVGHPLRKDFSQVGYREVWYSDKAGRVVYRPVELTQEFKFFKFKPLWRRK